VNPNPAVGVAPSAPATSQQAAWVGPLIASMTLGLAPMFPEPHIVGKIRWIAGGAVGMSAVDWGDFLMHGAPWALLAWTLVQTWAPRAQGAQTGRS